MAGITWKSVCRRAALSIVLLCASGAAVAAPNPICPGVGRLDGLRDGETRVQKLDVARMWIERDKKKQPASNGMPLCEKDLIVTTAKVSAIVQMGETADKAHDITIYPDSTIRLKKANAVEIVVGRLFASLHGAFDIWTTFGVLGARGTQFELTAMPDGLDVAQVEGQTTFPPANSSVVPKGMQLIYRSQDPSALSIKPLEPGQCESVTNDNSAVVSTTRARRPSRNLNLSFAAEERAKAFREAREAALCKDNDAARAQLIRVYADWGQPLDALSVLKNVHSEKEVTARADVVASLAQATRLAGESEQAIAGYSLALKINPKYAVAYNGIGDSYRDLGLVAYGRKNIPQALDYFDKAETQYKRALEPDVKATDAGWNDGVPLANLGELYLFRAVAQPDQAAARLEAAEGYFNQALAITGGDAPFATVGLARADLIRAKLIPDVTVSGDNLLENIAKQLEEDRKVREQRRPFVESAQRRLRGLIEKHPEFSVASEAYGTALLLLGQTANAQPYFVNAIQLDPHNPFAYLGFAASESNARRRELYKETADTIDYPAFHAVTAAREKMQRGGDSPAVPANQIVPSASKLSFNSDSYRQTVTLTVSGRATLPIDQVTVGGADAAVFRVTEDNCSGRQFAPNESCTFAVTFSAGGDIAAAYQGAPNKTSFSATLSIRSSAQQITTSIELRGKMP